MAGFRSFTHINNTEGYRMKVLAVGLEPTVVSFLQSKNISVDTGNTIKTAQHLGNHLEKGLYNGCVVVLGKKGFDLTIPRAIRSRGVETPLVGITVVPDSSFWSDQRATFLEYGGDDLIRGYEPREIAASLRAIAQRSILTSQRKLEYLTGGAHLVVDTRSHLVTVNGKRVSFTKKEMELFLLFTQRPDRLFSQESLNTLLYGEQGPESNVIRVRISHLRRKLRAVHPDGEKFIHLVHGVGYFFQSRRLETDRIH